MLDNELPSYEVEQGLTPIEANNSIETLVAGLVAELDTEKGSDDESILRDEASEETETPGVNTSQEELDNKWVESNIVGAPTPFNSPHTRTGKSCSRDFGEELDGLNI